MVIRRATPTDIESIYDLEINTFSVPWSKEAITKEFDNPVATYFVAEEEDKIVGYVGVWCVLDEGQITNVAVHKEYRRLGIGKRLIEELKSFGSEKDLQVFLLEVRESNTAAQKLYESCGFKMLGKRKKYYSKPTEDALLMEHSLGGNVSV